MVSAHESADGNVVIIHVDEQGFVPNAITIAPDTEVIFENVGTQEHWPASDNHPSHTLYHGTSLEEHCNDTNAVPFDSCGPIKSGETWSFVFEKYGVFGYHDHLWPHLEGSVTVTDEHDTSEPHHSWWSQLVDFLRDIFERIVNFFSKRDAVEEEPILNQGNVRDEWYEGLKVEYQNIVLRSDPREAIQLLRQESSKDNKVMALCHDILHEIGHTAYEKYGNFSEAATYQSDFCNSGYIHGLFESYFQSAEDPLAGLAEQCDMYASARGREFDLWQCHHGIGHGFMYLTGGDLDKSLALCVQGLGETAGRSCQNGAFMEVFNLEVLAKESEYIDPTNPFVACATREEAKGDCYLYVPTYLSQTLGMDFAEMFDACNDAEAAYVTACITGVGSEAMKRNMDRPEAVFGLCNQAGSTNRQEVCTAGAVRMYMNQEGSYTAGVALCEQAPQRFRGLCDDVVTGSKAFFD